jgi:sugar/nucleoside kinase (ribokinase family)
LIQGGSCSLSAGKAVDATIYAMKRAHELGKLVGFDVNYRNLMWNDDKAACTEKIKDVLPYVDLLKISDEEVDMVGGHENIPNFMKEYDIAVVVLTLGKDGSECFFKDQSYVIPGYKADYVADTTGAGDAFWGGFLSRLLILGADSVDKFTEEILKDAVNYGNVSGSLAVREKGAIASLPTRAQIETFLQENK